MLRECGLEFIEVVFEVCYGELGAGTLERNHSCVAGKHYGYCRTFLPCGPRRGMILRPLVNTAALAANHCMTQGACLDAATHCDR